MGRGGLSVNEIFNRMMQFSDTRTELEEVLAKIQSTIEKVAVSVVSVIQEPS